MFRYGHTRLTCLLVSLILPTFGYPSMATAAPGDLDPSFGNGGIVLTPSSNVGGYAIALQGDGRIVAVGGSTTFLLARYNLDGSLDSTFGNNGIVSTGISGQAYAVALQSDGKIVTAGHSASSIFNGNFALARFDTAGVLDPTFGQSGVTVTNMGAPSQAAAVAIQSDGKILAGGGYVDHGTGAVDMLLQPNGQIVLPGGNFSPTHFALARYDASGVLDGTFGNGGIVITAIPPPPQNRDSTGTLVRYNSDGSLDSFFGTNGIVLTKIGDSNEYSSVVSDAATGQLTVAGGAISGGTQSFALARYNSDGSLDPAFGNGGTTITAATAYATALRVIRQPNGRIIVVGPGGPSGCGFRVARYEATGALDLTFGQGGIVSTPIGCIVHDVDLQFDGKIVVIGDDNWNGFGLARYEGDSCGSNCTTTPTPASTPSSNATCNPVPDTGCRRPTKPLKSTLIIRNELPDTSGRFKWKWTQGQATSITDFGDPTTATPYVLCLYDAVEGAPELRLAALIPPGGTCGTKPCWKPTTRGYKYGDGSGEAHGFIAVTLKNGLDGRAAMMFTAKGANTRPPALPFTQNGAIVVEVKNDRGVCWSADYSPPAIVNSQTSFRDKSD